TRELAIQIDESFAAYGKFTGLKHTVIFGGVSQMHQVNALRAGVDILVATPGRLLDLMNQGFIDLRQLKIFILDEADRMLDMGFIHDVKKVILKIPAKRQTLFFSATMPPEIQKLANTILVNPAKVEVTPPSTTVEAIQQGLYFVDKNDKPSLLLHLLKNKSIVTALVFTRTKHGADKVVKFLHKHEISAAAIHGNKSQNARQHALGNFKSGNLRVLVATDIAARGIDIDELTHVINFELPNIPETYVHRIGRTGRAGASGIALSFCEAEEREFLRDINKLIGKAIPVIEDNPYAMQVSAPVQQTANTRQITVQKNNAGVQQRTYKRNSERNWRGGQRSFVKR
ncbi:MAG TPA: helicase-related protein, partial [Panacibacter sp.]|nr:helicase-related protein [Panacibacter sp.]